ncbi:MAG TPA: thiopeptide-type bacteriocin [Longimicrobiaceae bacterium]|nr:thiopeptide-type bacteriocin [Longimicrobiaceae bacterium]
MATLDTLRIDLSDLVIDDIEVLAQEGGRGIPEFAASSCTNCNCQSGGCSCTVEQVGTE